MFTLLEALRRGETGESNVYELENALGRISCSNLANNKSHKSKIELPASVYKWHRNAGFLSILDALDNIILIDLSLKRISWIYSTNHLLTGEKSANFIRVASTGHVIFSFGDFNHSEYVVLFEGKIIKTLPIEPSRNQFCLKGVHFANYTIIDQHIVGVTQTSDNKQCLVAWDLNGKRVLKGDVSSSFDYLFLKDGDEPYIFSTIGKLYNRRLDKVFDTSFTDWDVRHSALCLYARNIAYVSNDIGLNNPPPYRKSIKVISWETNRFKEYPIPFPQKVRHLTMCEKFIFYICDEDIVWSINRSTGIIKKLQQLDANSPIRYTFLCIEQDVLTVIYPNDVTTYKKWSLDLTSGVASEYQINEGAGISKISYEDGLILSTSHNNNDTFLYLEDYKPVTPTVDFDGYTSISTSLGI